MLLGNNNISLIYNKAFFTLYIKVNPAVAHYGGLLRVLSTICLLRIVEVPYYWSWVSCQVSTGVFPLERMCLLFSTSLLLPLSATLFV